MRIKLKRNQHKVTKHTEPKSLTEHKVNILPIVQDPLRIDQSLNVSRMQHIASIVLLGGKVSGDMVFICLMLLQHNL